MGKYNPHSKPLKDANIEREIELITMNMRRDTVSTTHPDMKQANIKKSVIVLEDNKLIKHILYLVPLHN